MMPTISDKTGFLEYPVKDERDQPDVEFYLAPFVPIANLTEFMFYEVFCFSLQNTIMILGKNMK